MTSRIEIVSDWIEEAMNCPEDYSSLDIALWIDKLYTEELKRITDHTETLTTIIKALQNDPLPSILTPLHSSA